MSVTRFIKELFGWGIVAEQPFLFEINENQQLYFPILGRGFSTDETISSGNKDNGHTKVNAPIISKEKASKVSSTPPAIYNIINLDGSGSTRSVWEKVVTGYNRLLQSIKDAGHHMKEIMQYNSPYLCINLLEINILHN